jgi:hypothetical protein
MVTWQVEVDKLLTWKESATGELETLQSGARATAIWAAAAAERKTVRPFVYQLGSFTVYLS